MASNFPGEGQPSHERQSHHFGRPSRPGGTAQPGHTEARAELRDRETYYAELRFAVHCESRSIPVPRPALDEDEGFIWMDESWDEMIARFGGTWT